MSCMYMHKNFRVSEAVQGLHRGWRGHPREAGGMTVLEDRVQTSPLICCADNAMVQEGAEDQTGNTQQHPDV